MNDDVLVSICVPAFNAGRYIRDTLNTLITQSHKNIEILVQDNASDDDTGSIVRTFEERDPRVKLFTNTENIGYVRNIYTLAERARGAILCIYHADDLYQPTIVEEELATLLNAPADGVFCRYKDFYKEGGMLRKYGTFPRSVGSAPFFVGSLGDYLPVLLEQGNPFCCPSFMTKKDIFLSIGGFTDDYPSNEDMDLWLRYLQAGYRLAIVDQFLLHYRRSLSQGSAWWGKKPTLPAFYKVVEDHLAEIEGIPEPLRVSFLRNKAKGYIFAFKNAISIGLYRDAAALIKASKKAYRMKPRDGAWYVFQYLPILYFMIKTVRDTIKRRF